MEVLSFKPECCIARGNKKPPVEEAADMCMCMQCVISREGGVAARVR